MTMTQKIIAIAVTIIIISTVAIPVIDDLQESQKSAANNTSELFNAVIGSGEDITITTSDGAASINGYAAPSGVDVFVSASLVVFYNNGLKVVDMVNNFVGAVSGSIVISDRTFNYTTAGSVEKSGTITGTYLYLAENGTYGQFKPQDGARFNNNSQMYGVVLTAPIAAVNYTAVTAFVSGSVRGGFVVNEGYDLVNGSLVDVTSTLTPKLTYTETDGYNVLSAASVVADVSGSSGYAGILHIYAPIQYHYISDEDSSLFNLIGVIPIILILVPLMLAVRMIALKRN